MQSDCLMEKAMVLEEVHALTSHLREETVQDKPYPPTWTTTPFHPTHTHSVSDTLSCHLQSLEAAGHAE